MKFCKKNVKLDTKKKSFIPTPKQNAIYETLFYLFFASNSLRFYIEIFILFLLAKEFHKVTTVVMNEKCLGNWSINFDLCTMTEIWKRFSTENVFHDRLLFVLGRKLQYPPSESQGSFKNVKNKMQNSKSSGAS